MKIVHESDVEEKLVPGRHIRWIADDTTLQPEFLSSCIIRVAPGATVRPSHAHPNGEELIYIMTGTGKVFVDGEIEPIRPGSTILFPRGKVHQVRNTSDEEMKVICFFAPATSLDDYEMHEEIAFPDGE